VKRKKKLYSVISLDGWVVCETFNKSYAYEKADENEEYYIEISEVNEDYECEYYTNDVWYEFKKEEIKNYV
jgi:hypothetical protein